MEAHFPGPMPSEDLFQAVWQFRHDFIARYASTVQIKEAILTLSFCNERGEEVKLRNEHGRQINRYKSPHVYRAAADFYDAQNLEAEILTKDNKPPLKHIPFSPI